MFAQLAHPDSLPSAAVGFSVTMLLHSSYPASEWSRELSSGQNETFKSIATDLNYSQGMGCAYTTRTGF